VTSKVAYGRSHLRRTKGGSGFRGKEGQGCPKIRLVRFSVHATDRWWRNPDYTCLSIVERARNADLDREGVATGENDFMDERLKYKLWSMDAGGDNEHFTDEHVEDKSWSTIDDRRR
jgi:hypothetical protein